MNDRVAYTAQDRADAEELLIKMRTSFRMDNADINSWARDHLMGFDDERRWLRRPVGVREFVESSLYLDDQSTWPEVMNQLEEINSGRYTECVLTGAIGVAKTTIAVDTIAYQLYILSCLRDPHAELDQNPRDEIVMVVQALTKEAAKEVGYTRMRNALDRSPYFKASFPFNESLSGQMRFPRNIRVIPLAGHETAAIGQNVIGGILDEINFMKIIEKSVRSRDGMIFDQAKKNYNTVARRRTSRFMKKGWTPGMLCLVSSRNYPGQFTDEKEAEAVTNKRIFVYDKRLWELQPEKYNPERFTLFIGDDTRRPRIVEDKANFPKADAHLLIEVPTDLKPFFEGNDIMGALKDIVGVAPSSIHPFIMDKQKLTEAFGKVESVLSQESCDFKKTKVIYYPAKVKNKERMRWAHYDPGLTKDHGGFACGYVSHFVNIKRGPDIETLPFIVFDCVLDIIPPSNGEIEFENVHKLLYTMRDKGLKIVFFSADTFQSRGSLQTLGQAGFKVGIRSMDDDTGPYDVAKTAFYDGRVQLPKHDRAMMELARIELDVKHKKINHAPNGSKDCSDAIAGVIYGLSMQREIWREHAIPLQAMPKHMVQILEAIAREKNSVDSRERRNAHEERSTITRV